MAGKPRNKAGIDADAVARMMREADEPAEAPAPAEPAPPVAEPAPVVQAAPPAEPVQQAEPAPAPLAPLPPYARPLRPMPEFDPGKLDGRTLRRTGREPFASRIKPETHEALKRIAWQRQITIAEALEMAVAAFQDA